MLIAAAVLLLVIGLLAIPVELDFHLSTDPTAERRLDLRWLFGLVRADLSDAWRAIGKRGLDLRLRIGLGDPADTGRLWALVGPLSGYLAASGQAVIAVEPDFVDSVFEARGSGALSVVPLRMLGLVTGLLLSPPVWRGLWRMRAAR